MELREYDYMELIAEVRRRDAAGAAGICDYCGRAGDSAPCEKAERHRNCAETRGVER